MYLDVMTNLKNRNYLNDNLSYWESNKIYPQAVVIIDLNNIAHSISSCIIGFNLAFLCFA